MQDIVEKIKKILLLAQDKASQPGEIASALARARKLAVKHNIDLASIDLTQDERRKEAIQIEKNSTIKLRTGKTMAAYHPWIFKIFREVFEVEIVFNFMGEGKDRVIYDVHAYGDPFDVAIAVAVFPWLEDMMLNVYFRAVLKKQLSESAEDMNGCFAGLAEGIISNNQREEAKAALDVSGYALVLRSKADAVKEKIGEDFPDLKREEMQKECSPVGMYIGETHGRRINLRQAGDGKKNNLR